MGKGKILLAEDNRGAVRRIVEYIGKISGELEVISFAGAGEALRYARENEIALFIIDIQLEDYKGTDLAKQLRGLPEYRYTPIIFETGLAGEELSAYRDVKCYSFLVKPFGENRREGRRIQLEQKQFILEYAAEDIVYIEAFGKKLVIHTDNRLSGRKEDTVSGYTLAGMLALLEGGPFVQCHKSYIVNRDYIDRIDKAGRKIYLKGFTEVVPVGNKYQDGLWGEA